MILGSVASHLLGVIDELNPSFTLTALSEASFISGNGSVFTTIYNPGGSPTIRNYTSPDGISWTLQDSLPSDYWRGITTDGSQFVAIAVNGASATSPDGITWTNHSIAMAATRRYTYISYNGTNFLSTGTDVSVPGTIFFLTSSDGISWAESSKYINQPRGIPTGNGSDFCFITSGTAGPTFPTSYVSTDNGVNWTGYSSAILDTENSWEISSNGSIYLALGWTSPNSYVRCATSSDGITWVDRGTITSVFVRPACLTSNGDYFFAIAGEQYHITADGGITWQTFSITPTSGGVWLGLAPSGVNYLPGPAVVVGVNNAWAARIEA